MVEKESKVVFMQAVVNKLYPTGRNTFIVQVIQVIIQVLYYYRLIQMEETFKTYSHFNNKK